MFSDWSKPNNDIYENLQLNLILQVFREYTSFGATDGDDNNDNDEDDFDDDINDDDDILQRL